MKKRNYSIMKIFNDKNKNKANTYGEFKKTKIYKEASDTAFYLNASGPYNEMYYQYELDNLPVIGFSSDKDGILIIDLVCEVEDFERLMGFKRPK